MAANVATEATMVMGATTGYSADVSFGTRQVS